MCVYVCVWSGSRVIGEKKRTAAFTHVMLTQTVPSIHVAAHPRSAGNWEERSRKFASVYVSGDENKMVVVVMVVVMRLCALLTSS